jgi:hypothetical protein
MRVQFEDGRVIGKFYGVGDHVTEEADYRNPPFDQERSTSAGQPRSKIPPLAAEGQFPKPAQANLELDLALVEVVVAGFLQQFPLVEQARVVGARTSSEFSRRSSWLIASDR